MKVCTDKKADNFCYTWKNKLQFNQQKQLLILRKMIYHIFIFFHFYWFFIFKKKKEKTKRNRIEIFLKYMAITDFQLYLSLV